MLVNVIIPIFYSFCFFLLTKEQGGDVLRPIRSRCSETISAFNNCKNNLWLDNMDFVSDSSESCEIQIVNKAKEVETFYLTIKGKLLDSIRIDKDAFGCFNITTDRSLLQLDTKKSKSRLLFFKDKSRPVKILFGGGREFLVEGSKLDSIWRVAVSIQDSLIKNVENCASRSSGDSAFISVKEKYENWCFNEFTSMLSKDTILAVRFLNHHVLNLRRITFVSPIYTDSIIHLVSKFNPPNIDLLNDLTSLSRLRLGSQMVHFPFTSQAGDTLNTSEFFVSQSGDKVLVDFWASWCKPCRAKNKTLKERYAALRARNIQILGISLDEKAPAWENALAEDELPWPQGLIPGSELKKIQRVFNCYAIPCSLLFSPKGELLLINPTIEDLLKH
ncbi:MAG: Thiol-disulfide oxidoreductase ResA [Haliscomenobacter sp.]|jgi:thiol-disulfide isomerase/thioredoxin|nr:Thiol-disulfide oxidoreductase ResA [Haliscomenobacter sp.]